MFGISRVFYHGRRFVPILRAGLTFTFSATASACGYSLDLVYQGNATRVVQQGSSAEAVRVQPVVDARPSSERRGKGVITGDDRFRQSVAQIVTEALETDLRQSHVFGSLTNSEDARYQLATELLSFKTERRESGMVLSGKVVGWGSLLLGTIIWAQTMNPPPDCQVSPSGIVLVCTKRDPSLLGPIVSVGGAIAGAVMIHMAGNYNASTVTLRSTLRDRATGRELWSGTFYGRGEFKSSGRKYQQAVDESLSPALAQANARLISSVADFLASARRP